MANHKSARKRARQDIKRCHRNKHTKSTVRTFEKKLLTAIGAGDKIKATELLLTWTRLTDKVAQKGIYHVKKAARKISRFSKKVHNIS